VAEWGEGDREHEDLGRRELNKYYSSLKIIFNLKFLKNVNFFRNPHIYFHSINYSIIFINSLFSYAAKSLSLSFNYLSISF
jgi:hypothetical protein